MGLIKGILKYIFILALLVLSAIVITVGAMYVTTVVNPNAKLTIFGYTLYIFDERKDDVVLNYNTNEITTIEFNVKNTAIQLEGTEETAIHYQQNNRMWGIVKVEDNSSYGFSYSLENGVLKFTVTEPEGLLLNTSSSYLTVRVPETFVGKDIVVNGENSSVLIGNAGRGVLAVKDIKLNVNRSKVIISKLKKLANIEINSKNNTTEINEKVFGEVKISTGISKLTLENASKITANASNLKIQADTVNEVNITSDSGVLHLNKVYIVNSNGNISSTINTLYSSYSDTGRTNANLNIANAYGVVTSSCTSGETNITKAEKALNITSTVGNIKLKEVNSDVTIKTTSGICVVEMKENNINTLNFTAKNGSLKASNLSNTVNINIENDGVCELNLAFKNVVGDNIINAKNGNVQINLPIQPLILNIQSNINTDILYADIETTEKTVAQNISGADEGCANKLTVNSNSGKVTLRANTK